MRNRNRGRLPSLEKAKQLQPLLTERQKLINDLKEAKAKGALTPAEFAAQHASCDLLALLAARFVCVCAHSASARHWCLSARLTNRTWRALPLQTLPFDGRDSLGLQGGGQHTAAMT